MDTVVEFNGVFKKYGKLPVLEDINLSVRQDDFMVIYGLPSSGKTVLLRLLIGLEEPDSGHYSAGRRCSLHATEG